MAKTAQRRHDRHVHGMRRLKEDRQQHGEDHSCPCFAAAADKGKGAEFARFADTPNSYRYYLWFDEPSRQERRAPTVRDWD